MWRQNAGTWVDVRPRVFETVYKMHRFNFTNRFHLYLFSYRLQQIYYRCSSFSFFLFLYLIITFLYLFFFSLFSILLSNCFIVLVSIPSSLSSPFSHPLFLLYFALLYFALQFIYPPHRFFPFFLLVHLLFPHFFTSFLNFSISLLIFLSCSLNCPNFLFKFTILISSFPPFNFLIFSNISHTSSSHFRIPLLSPPSPFTGDLSIFLLSLNISTFFSPFPPPPYPFLFLHNSSIFFELPLLFLAFFSSILYPPYFFSILLPSVTPLTYFPLLPIYSHYTACFYSCHTPQSPSSFSILFSIFLHSTLAPFLAPLSPAAFYSPFYSLSLTLTYTAFSHIYFFPPKALPLLNLYTRQRTENGSPIRFK